MVDAVDLKSTGYFYPCWFKSGLRHHDSLLVASRSYLANGTVDTSFLAGIEQPALFQFKNDIRNTINRIPITNI